VLFYTLFVALLCGCNNIGGKVEKVIHNEISKSKVEMDNELESNKIQFNSLCTKVLNNTKDSIAKQRLKNLQSSVIQTAAYLDSLKKEMDRLDENDVNNVRQRGIHLIQPPTDPAFHLEVRYKL